MTANAWRPALYAPPPTKAVPRAASLGQPIRDRWTFEIPRFTVSSAGGMLLLTGSALSMLLSKDRRPLLQAGRAASGLFGAYTVAREGTHRTTAIPSTFFDEYALPVLGLLAVVGAMTGLGYLALK